MPYKSKAQQRLFHANPDLAKKYAHKWDEETKQTKKGFKGLPNKVKKKKGKSVSKTKAKKRSSKKK